MQLCSSQTLGAPAGYSKSARDCALFPCLTFPLRRHAFCGWPSSPSELSSDGSVPSPDSLELIAAMVNNLKEARKPWRVRPQASSDSNGLAEALEECERLLTFRPCDPDRLYLFSDDQGETDSQQMKRVASKAAAEPGSHQMDEQALRQMCDAAQRAHKAAAELDQALNEFEPRADRLSPSSEFRNFKLRTASSTWSPGWWANLEESNQQAENGLDALVAQVDGLCAGWVDRAERCTRLLEESEQSAYRLAAVNTQLEERLQSVAEVMASALLESEAQYRAVLSEGSEAIRSRDAQIVQLKQQIDEQMDMRLETVGLLKAGHAREEELGLQLEQSRQSEHAVGARCRLTLTAGQGAHLRAMLVAARAEAEALRTDSSAMRRRAERQEDEFQRIFDEMSTELLETNDEVAKLEAENLALHQKEVDSAQVSAGAIERAFDCIAEELCCPITTEILRDPVVARDGFTYEKAEIVKWFEKSNRSPLTNETLLRCDLVPNHTARALVDKLGLLQEQYKTST